METKNSSVQKKRSSSGIIVLIVLLVILAIIAAAAAVFIYNSIQTKNTLSLSGAMSAEELAELDKYVNLEELDLHGSTCYEAIAEYSAAHPQVNVLYSVEVDGIEIENKNTSLDWSGHSLSALTDAAGFIPWVSTISLGETDASLADIEALKQAFPDADISYSVPFMGRSYNHDETSVSLTYITSADCSAAAELLTKLPMLQTVSLPDSSSFDTDSFITLYNTRPDVRYEYSFELYGKVFTTDSEKMVFKKIEIGNEGIQELSRLVYCLPNISYIKIDRCEVDDEVMAEFRDAHPDIKIIWRVYFWKFSVLTDVESIWAIGGMLDKHTEALKYCTEVKYLDLGHNGLEDIRFVNYMPKLEVLIVSLNYTLSDITPLANCPELEYLELTLTKVSDLSPLSGLTKLRHLELSQCFWLTDITPIMNLELDRLHIMYSDIYGYDLIPQEQFDEFNELHPDCKTDFSSVLNPDGQVDPYNVSEWRYLDSGECAPRYALLRQQIGYDNIYNEPILREWMETDDDE